MVQQLRQKAIDHFALVVLAVVIVIALICFTVIELVGAEGATPLRDILFTLIGGLIAMVVGRKVMTKGDE